MNKFTELLGWYGTAVILIAYALLSFSIISANSITYQLLNLTGAIGIVIVSIQRKAYPPAVLNIAWTIIAIIAIMRILT